MKHLKDFYILHRFYARVLQDSGAEKLSERDVLKKIGSYEVVGKCQCSDKSCATVYLKASENFEEELCEMLSYDKAFVVLHHNEDGAIEIEALESFNYPYVEEFIDVFENKKTLANDVIGAQARVDEFFNNIVEEDLSVIVVE